MGMENDREGEMIGGVLTYEIKSSGRVCGNTIGADGSGEFAVVIEGTPDVADQWARDYLRKMEASGVRLGRILFVSGHETYSGCPIQTVAPNVELTGAAPTEGETKP